MVPGATFSGVSSLGKIFLYLAAVVLAGAGGSAGLGVDPPAFPRPARRVCGNDPGDALSSLSLPEHPDQRAGVASAPPSLASDPFLRAFSLVPDPRPFRDLGIGMAAGLLCMTLMIPFFLRFGACSLSSDWASELVRALPRVAATAVAVAVLEEFLFRGVLLGLLRQVMVPFAAVFLAAIPFALLHFFNLPRGGVGEAKAVCWWSGLEFARSGDHLPAPLAVVPLGFLTLFAAGLLLGWLTVRTGSLHAAIGLHGVWILSQQLFHKVSVFQSDTAALLPFIGPAQCSGAVPIGLVALGALLLGISGRGAPAETSSSRTCLSARRVEGSSPRCAAWEVSFSISCILRTAPFADAALSPGWMVNARPSANRVSPRSFLPRSSTVRSVPTP